MSATKTYRDDHAAIAALIKDFEATLDVAKLQTQAADCRKILSNLAGKLRIHLANEDRMLYPNAAKSQDAGVRALAERFQREMGPLATTFKTYSDRWLTPRDIASNATEFVAQSRTVMHALKERVRKENTEFYAALDKVS